MIYNVMYPVVDFQLTSNDVCASPPCGFWRYALLQKKLFQLEEAEGGFDQFTRSYNTFGVHRQSNNSMIFKEWAPAAEALFLTGDFSK